MSGTEICNLIDSLTKRGLDDSEIIEIIFETEGRQRQKRGDGYSPSPLKEQPKEEKE